MLKFLHTSDWQLGASFSRVPGDKGAILRAERLAAVERVGHLAEEHGAQFVVVAGDLFDAHTVANEVVTRALESIGRYPVPVYAIPGNHDFAAAPESVYKRDRFMQQCPDQLHILERAEPFALSDLNTMLLPAPLLHRHTVGDPTQWMIETDVDPARFRIGIAHGSVIDFQPEEGGTPPNLVDPTVAERAKLDYLALGDWHGTRQIGDRCWYSGTPEPDRFKDNEPGQVLLVEIELPGAVPCVTPIRSAGCVWLRHSASLHREADVDSLKRWFAELGSPQSTLVRLEVEGVLGMAAKARFESLIDTQRDLLLHLRVRGTGVQVSPTEEELDAFGREGLTGRVADSLRAHASAQSEVAGLALQMLYQRANQNVGGER